jgi:DNA-binding LacI/PurR family transcriptional regulator
MGQLAAKTLLELLNRKSDLSAPKVLTVEPTLIVRDSTAPAV